MPLESDAPADEAVAAARPYRSHRIPACDFCHRRKSRCHRTRLDEPCTLCRMHKKHCTTRPTAHMRRPTRPSSPLESPVLANPATNASDSSLRSSFQDAGMDMNRPRGDTGLAATDPGLSSHIVGPAVAPDVQMLEQYLSPAENGGPVSHVHPNPYSVYSDDPRNPVVYLKVPRQRTTASTGNGTSGFKQCEAIENIVQPLGPHVLDLYFDVVHPAFPVLDETAVKTAYQEGSLPHTLVCEIYAVSLVSWELSPKIVASRRPRPDMRYIWNLTVSAMHEDFQTPSFSTVLACILDLLGRPITSITYNAINVGSAVALAQSLGLNRNPGKWKLDARQKNIRVKSWWALLIHDVWASLCHGTPGHIHRDQWDVDLPDLNIVNDDVAAGASVTQTRLRGAHSFILLCQLTNLLSEVLAIVYSLRSDPLEQTLRVLRRIDAHVDELQDSLPPWLNPADETFASSRREPGALNLQLSFLAVKICICRAALQATRVADDTEALYYQSRCIKIGNEFIDAVVALTPEETKAFWLPYIAYHFASAATLMMRCALEAQEETVATGCVNSARRLIDHLKKMKAQTNWDLADICLNQCEGTVKQMGQNNNLNLWRSRKADLRLQTAQATAPSSERGPDGPSGFDGDVVVQPDEFSAQGGFLDEMQNHMMEDFYFPEMWQVSHF
ncbi:putative Zn(II)2Cys6 transcription factor [Plectosphaerella cucumerina]|uniref:Zn(II)2Cys6 transcription factor n=1 Tax=Plectosphaerella cucumerina TaxID=40658 RepID=A0A8K0X7H1_9PEZI|nr:putative Zn(II)2Cys6 transcription factor [Plectosphaerella cucumerina]